MNPDEINTTDLNIDLGCPLFIQSRLINERIPSSLIGLIPHSGLIIKTPPLSNIDDVMPPGNEIVIRYVFLGEVFGFKSRILNTINTPFKLTFVTYPDLVEKLCLRKDKRISCNFPATIYWGNMEIRGTVVDISSLGTLFTVKNNLEESINALEVDTEIILQIPMLEGGTSELFHGRIRNNRQDLNGISLGIQFIHMSHELSEKITNYINEVSGEEK